MPAGRCRHGRVDAGRQRAGRHQDAEEGPARRRRRDADAARRRCVSAGAAARRRVWLRAQAEPAGRTAAGDQIDGDRHGEVRRFQPDTAGDGALRRRKDQRDLGHHHRA